MPSIAQYDPLPRSSLELDSLSEEFKDKPIPRRRNAVSRIARKARRICRFCRPIYIIIAFILFLLWQFTFNTSYTNPQPFSIPEGENVYIAANIIDGDLISGAWGKTLLELVELIGKERVYVSIYGGPKDKLEALGTMLECGHSLVSEEKVPLDMAAIPKTTLPTGETKVKRIAYLAEVRNKALEPLDTLKMKFDKVLFINDVFFEAEGAARLLWGTNVRDGKASYKAACGTDFVAWWKFYDTFATRDMEGYSLGVPIFPWFANEGDAVSRKDVLEGRDAVRVKSCWGGITAFDARYLQKDPKGTKSRDLALPTIPLKFRSEPEPFWDSSECCLIHADIMALPSFPEWQAEGGDSWDQGIYMNPNVRVSYDAKTQSRLGFARWVERLFALPQAIINHFAHMPVFNARRAEVEGEVVKDRVWKSLSKTKQDGEGAVAKRDIIGEGMEMGNEYWAKKGHYVDEERIANRGAYCGVRQLLVMKEGKLEEGQGNWDNLLNELPPLGL